MIGGTCNDSVADLHGNNHTNTCEFEEVVNELLAYFLVRECS